MTDDGIHLKTWNRLRTLLRHPHFIYVAQRNTDAEFRRDGLFSNSISMQSSRTDVGRGR